nr:DUF3558 family protein [Nocardia terpenica]
MVSGCKSNDSEPPKPRISDRIPTSFDPCSDIPPDVITSQQLMPDPKRQAERDDGDGVKSSGCEYRRSFELTQTRGTGISVDVTNMTVDYFSDVYSKSNSVDGTPVRRLTINNRPAAIQGPRSDNTCMIITDIKDGGVRFDNAAHTVDPCQVLIEFVQAVSTHLPA